MAFNLRLVGSFGPLGLCALGHCDMGTLYIDFQNTYTYFIGMKYVKIHTYTSDVWNMLKYAHILQMYEM